MEEEWLALPQIARELGIADSTARRWAGLWPEWVKTKGHGSGRRFHRDTKELFVRVQTLYDQGYAKEQITAVLRQEFSAMIDAVALPEPTAAPTEAALLVLAEGLQTALHDMEEHLLAKLTASQTEVAALRDQVVQLTRRLDEQEQPFVDSRGVPYIMPRQRTDADLMAEIRAAVQSAVAESIEASPRRSWWPPWKR